MSEIRADRIRAKIAAWEKLIPETAAEAAMLRKIAADLVAKADKLEVTLAYQVKSLAEDKDHLFAEETRA